MKNKYTKKWRREQSKRMSGKNNPFYGRKHSEETKRKIGEKNKGRVCSKKTREKMSIVRKGKTYEEIFGKERANQYKINLRLVLKGRKVSLESRKKLSQSLRKGYKEGKIKPPWNKGKNNCYTKNTLKRMSESSTGKIVTEETKEKISNSLKNRIFSKEHRKNLSKSGKGKIISIERREKIRKTLIEKEISSGENNPNWQGEISKEPYDLNWNNKFKRAIRKRDNQICMLCGVHKEKFNYALHVHHINYNKKLSIPQNCISLCRSCHTKTSYNRQHWIRFFQSLLFERYNYEYKDAEIVLGVKQ